MPRNVENPLQMGRQAYARVMGRAYLVNVLGVSKDTFWVSFPAADYPVPGVPVQLEFHDLDGFVSYHTQVVIGPRNKGDGMVLERSAGVSRMKHRRSWRVPTDLGAGLRAGEGDDTSLHSATILDLSAQGALVETDARGDVGAVVALSFALEQGAAFTVTARIIHAGEAEPAGYMHYGVLFVDMPAHVRRALTQFLWQRIRKHYRSELAALYPRSARRRNAPDQPNTAQP